MIDFILIILCVATLLIVWVAACNTKTLNQRIDILESCKPTSVQSATCINDIREIYIISSIKLDMFKSVSYYKHLFFVMTFRNPMKLYKFKD